MGLDEVKKQLIEDAQKQARLFVDEAKKEAKKILADAEAEAKQYELQLKVNTEKMLEAAEKRESAAAEFGGKRLVLDIKKSILLDTIEVAKKKMLQLSSEQKKVILQRMLDKAQKEIEVKTVYLNMNDMSFIKNKGITVKEAVICGGMIAETGDGKVSINWGFDATIDQVKEKYLREISEVLFSE